MHIRWTSVLLAAIIVGLAMAGAWWLQYYRQFPWVVFFGVFFPAQWIVVMAADPNPKNRHTEKVRVSELWSPRLV